MLIYNGIEDNTTLILVKVLGKIVSRTVKIEIYQ